VKDAHLEELDNVLLTVASIASGEVGRGLWMLTGDRGDCGGGAAAKSSTAIPGRGPIMPLFTPVVLAPASGEACAYGRARDAVSSAGFL
jgi:hypothetical protein